jgi:hypothetical protein
VFVRDHCRLYTNLKAFIFRSKPREKNKGIKEIEISELRRKVESVYINRKKIEQKGE